MAPVTRTHEPCGIAVGDSLILNDCGREDEEEIILRGREETEELVSTARVILPLDPVSLAG